MKAKIWIVALIAVRLSPAAQVGAQVTVDDAAQLEAASGASDAPDVFKVKFECSNGSFVAEFHKEWAPLGVQRMYDLVKADFFNEARFFRVVANFMAQFGLAGDPKANEKWNTQPLGVEPVKQSNTRGMITFAMGGKPAKPKETDTTRTTQLFINFGDNSNLDPMGFAPIGKVVEGMETVDAFYSAYGDGPPWGTGPNQGLLKSQGNKYLQEKYPKLDYIKTATIVTE